MESLEGNKRPLVHQSKSRPIISKAHTPHHKDMFLKKVNCPSKLMLEKKKVDISPHEPYIILMLPTLPRKFFNVTITKDKDCNHLILKLYKQINKLSIMESLEGNKIKMMIQLILS